ncbi:aminopeptidase N [Buchananella hordeovulneris]|uniref:aminopeptidase N n=1 Tax=Buchananella hordeovulneris TaxID=52770 RepID=UPI000F5E2977|nr:aminopeptidase N [Buchananella hordeovulneris]RRD53833.1 aminopeptidase N [Buchananella hordeovulneris]
MAYNLTRHEAAHRSQIATLHATSVHLDLSHVERADAQTFTATSTLEFTLTEPDIFIDCVAHTVDEVQLDDQPVPFQHDGSRIFLTGLQGGRHRVQVAATMQYSRTGEGLHRNVDPVDGQVYLYTQFEPTDARRAYACFDQPDFKAPFTLSVTAPSSFTVVANQPALSRTSQGQVVTTHFAPTPPISSYLTAVCAGPYARLAGQTWRGNCAGAEVVIPVNVYVRASLAARVDIDFISTITSQGLSLMHERFGYAYPWGKYDQVFVPEYNLGAMENPGCVTFTEAFLPKSTPTTVERQRLANTILHEMAHMWFGDLVTPLWWDDLWLKESFADFMGSYAVASATEFTDEWVSFCVGRKRWAYLQDSYRTTHPILADIPDVEAASQNFDGITYAKGAAVLKQLVAFVGEENFFAATRAFFTRHAFATATLKDFLVCLSQASGRDMSAWAQVWLGTAGPSLLRCHWHTDPSGKVAHLELTQEGSDGPAGSPVLRPHRINIGCYQVQGEALQLLARFPTTLTAARGELTAARGLTKPDLIVVNDDDLTYGICHLDPVSTATALRHVSRLPGELSAAVVWSSLYNMVRDGALPATDFLTAVLTHAPHTRDTALVTELLRQAQLTVENYVAPAGRDAARQQWASGLAAALQAAEPGAQLQQLLARALVGVRLVPEAYRPTYVPQLHTLLAEQLPGLEVGQELRWEILIALQAAGASTTELVRAEQQRDPSGDGQCAVLRLQAATGTFEAKKTAWNKAVSGDLTNDQVSACINGFTQADDALLGRFVDEYFALLPTVWQQHSIGIARRLVVGLFPLYTPTPQEVAERTRQVLASTWPTRALARLLKERLDELERNQRVQATQ